MANNLEIVGSSIAVTNAGGTDLFSCTVFRATFRIDDTQDTTLYLQKDVQPEVALRFDELTGSQFTTLAELKALLYKFLGNFNTPSASIATEGFFAESNTSLLLKASNSSRKKAVIVNEGYRDMYLGYVGSATQKEFITIAPNGVYEEKVFTGDIHGIWKYNATGNASTEEVLITSAAAFNLGVLYLNLKNETATSATFPPLTNLTTVTAGVYKQAAATTPTGTITLDGQGDANSIFLFVVTGALSISASCEFILIDGATANNVFWVTDGALTLGANSVCVGNFIGLVAVTLGADCVLNGRALSLGGALANNGDAYVTSSSLTSPFELGYLVGFALFTSAGALSNAGAGNIITGDIGTNLGAITGFSTATLTGNEYNSTSLIDVVLPNGGARIIEITT